MSEIKDGTEPKPQGEKKQNIKKIMLELESLKSPITETYVSDFSNDTEVSVVMPKIIESVNKSESPLKTAIIIGSGPLWNIPKEFNVDLIISLDINQNQLEHNKQRIQKILSAQNINSLLPKPDDNVKKDDFIAVKKERDKMEASKTEQNSYLSYHYLSSEKKLYQTQTFLKKDNIAFVGGDIADHDFTKTLGIILHKHKAGIVFVDLSNVMEWVAGGLINQDRKNNFLESLKNLPILEECPMLHSRSIGRVGRSPIVSQLSFGLIDYGQKYTPRGR